MQLWHWVLLIGLLFLITYSPRTGNLRDFFDPEIPEGDDVTQSPSREAQSNRHTRKHSE